MCTATLNTVAPGNFAHGLDLHGTCKIRTVTCMYSIIILFFSHMHYENRYIIVLQGDGPKLVRELFRVAEEHSPSIVFIDEIDAIGTKRYNNYKAFLLACCICYNK